MTEDCDENIRDTVDDQGHRIAVAVYYLDVLDSPPPSEWDGKDGTVAVIRRNLKFPEGSGGTIRAVLVDVYACVEDGSRYTGEAKLNQGGKNILIEPGSVEEQIAADAIEGGVGFTNAMHLVNEYRTHLDPPLEHVGRSAVWSAIQRLEPKTTAVLVCKQGSYDPTSEWAKARHRFTNQLLVQFSLKTPMQAWVEVDNIPLVLQNPANIPSYFDVTKIGGTLSVNQIAYWDETHKKPVIGGKGHEAAGSRMETRFRRDATGKLHPNGTYGDRRKLLQVKYSATETRLCLGVVCVERVVNTVTTVTGMRLPEFNYSGQWVRTEKEMEALMIAEQKRVKVGINI
jgi:hypothetical protein